jgi:hypothetical protein
MVGPARDIAQDDSDATGMGGDFIGQVIEAAFDDAPGEGFEVGLVHGSRVMAFALGERRVIGGYAAESRLAGKILCGLRAGLCLAQKVGPVLGGGAVLFPSLPGRASGTGAAARLTEGRAGANLWPSWPTNPWSAWSASPST